MGEYLNGEIGEVKDVLRDIHRCLGDHDGPLYNVRDLLLEIRDLLAARLPEPYSAPDLVEDCSRGVYEKVPAPEPPGEGRARVCPRDPRCCALAAAGDILDAEDKRRPAEAEGLQYDEHVRHIIEQRDQAHAELARLREDLEEAHQWLDEAVEALGSEGRFWKEIPAAIARLRAKVSAERERGNCWRKDFDRLRAENGRLTAKLAEAEREPPIFGKCPECGKATIGEMVRKYERKLSRLRAENKRLINEMKAIIAPTEVGGGVTAHLRAKLAEAQRERDAIRAALRDIVAMTNSDRRDDDVRGLVREHAENALARGGERA